MFFATYFVIWIFFYIVKHPIILRRISSEKIYINKKWDRYIISVAAIAFITIISNVINLYVDLAFSIYPISELIIFLSAAGLVVAWRSMKIPLTRQTVLELLFEACVLQCLLSILMYVFTPFYELWYSITISSDLLADALDRTEGFRLFGVGVNFFGAGVACSIGIFACVSAIKDIYNRWKIFLFIILGIFVFVVGSGMARTTQVGAIFAFLYFYVAANLWKTHIRKNIIFTSSLFIFLMVVGIVVVIFLIQTVPEIELLSQHAFEAVYNLFSEGKLYTKSSDHLLRSYPLPENAITWIIGDAKFVDPMNPTMDYYMHCDIGWYRLIYCVGLVGLVAYCYSQYCLYRIPSWGRTEALFLFLMFLAFLHKGMVDFTVYIAPLALIPFFKTKNEKNI